MLLLVLVASLAVLAREALAGNCGNSSWKKPTSPADATFSQLPLFYVGDQFDIEFNSDFDTILLRIYQQPTFGVGAGAGIDLLRTTNSAGHVTTQWKVGDGNSWNYNEGSNGPIYYLEFYGSDSSQDCTSSYFRLAPKASSVSSSTASASSTIATFTVSSSTLTSLIVTPTPNPSPNDSGDLSTSAKVGLGVGIPIGVLLLLLLLLALFGPPRVRNSMRLRKVGDGGSTKVVHGQNRYLAPQAWGPPAEMSDSHSRYELPAAAGLLELPAKSHNELPVH